MLAVAAALVVFWVLVPSEEDPPAVAGEDAAAGQVQAAEDGQGDTDSEPAPEPEVAEVPDVARASLSKAKARLQRADLGVRVVKEPSWKPVGTVLTQRMKAGREVSPGTVVTLVVASAMPMVPGTVGSMGKDALKALRKAGFRVKISRQTVTSGTTGTVLSQSPTGANRAAPGSVVEIVLANVVRPVAAAPAPSNCTPGYSPCLPPASDYDCAGGSGDGPEYTGFVRVTGSDPYGLDADGDGLACES
ncbi:PASTA domain-containing protein [Nocardioides aestuarii]|uniref:PASTA domain-containing protein n=1 Tax=Nocardioides aestuarii TaxID=252231 RepID=A0ABW4TM84_9ACTN